MNATDFIKEYGVEKARKVIEGAPDETITHFDLTIDGLFYFLFEKFDWFCFYNKHFIKVYMEDFESYHLTSLKELKRLVESVDFINKFGGIVLAKAYDKQMSDHGFDTFFDKAISDYESIYSDNDTIFGD